MKLNTIVKCIPGLDFVIEHNESVKYFENLNQTHFLGLEGLNLIPLREEAKSKLNNVYGEKKEFCAKVYENLDKCCFSENLDAYEHEAMKCLHEDLNNERSRYGRNLIAHRKVISPGPLDPIVNVFVEPVKTYKKVKYKGIKTLEFISGFRNLF